MREMNEVQLILEEKSIPEDAEICKDFIAEHDLLQMKIFDIIENIVPLGESVLAELHLKGEPLPGDPVAAYSMDSALIDVEVAMDGLKVREKAIMESWQEKKTFLMQCLRFYNYEEGYNKVQINFVCLSCHIFINNDFSIIHLLSVFSSIRPTLLILQLKFIIAQVLDWVTGPGFEQASKNWKIGDSVTSAEALRKEQDELEKATKVVYCFVKCLKMQR